MPKKKKGQRADGLIEIARKMPSGKVRHFYGHSRAECEDKYRRPLCASALSKLRKPPGRIMGASVHHGTVF